MPVIPDTTWYQQLTNPYADQNYMTSARPAGTGYTITGTGFGTKTGTPYYDDFESETLGAATSPVGDLVLSNAAAVSISSTTYSGTKSLANDFSVEDFPKIYKTLSGSNTKAYMAGYFKFTGTSGTVWKHGRIGSNAAYSGDPKAGSSFTSSSGSTIPSSDSGEMRAGDPPAIVGYSANNTGAYANDLSNAYFNDTWLFYELEFYTGTVSGSDSYYSERLSNKETYLWDGLTYLVPTNQPLPDWILTVLNGHDGVNTLDMFMDTIYIDESRARVVMTDNATYASSTKFAIQPIVSYADTVVTTNSRRQGFSIGATAYLHLFDNTGALVDSGSSFTVAADN